MEKTLIGMTLLGIALVIVGGVVSAGIVAFALAYEIFEELVCAIPVAAIVSGFTMFMFAGTLLEEYYGG